MQTNAEPTKTKSTKSSRFYSLLTHQYDKEWYVELRKELKITEKELLSAVRSLLTDGDVRATLETMAQALNDSKVQEATSRKADKLRKKLKSLEEQA